MWDFVAATGAGVLAGVVFDRYFRRRARVERRLPDEVEEAVR
jgi:cyanophycinase-like exopeptidase